MLTTILRAKYLVDAAFDVVENGALRIGDGRIVEVGRAGDFRGQPVRDLGDAVILPGLVNAHTHLELGFTAGTVPPSRDFTDWLERLLRKTHPSADHGDSFDRSVETGLAESIDAGTTLVGDVAREPVRTRAVINRTARRPAVVSYGEVVALGRIRGLAAERIEAACDATGACDDLRIGISPHAPYTVEPKVLAECVSRARAGGLPMCIHAAEVPAEEQYTTELRGPFRDYFERLGVWDEDIPLIGKCPIEYLVQAGALGPVTLLAHVNYPSDDDIKTLASTGTSVAFCPRTHRAFGHEPHRFREMMARGVNVCIGTDSLASNPSLSVLGELRFLRRQHEDLPARTILMMGTVHGAAALGAGGVAGAIEPGRRADVIALPIDPHGPANPIENVLQSRVECTAVIVGGRVAISYQLSAFSHRPPSEGSG